MKNAAFFAKAAAQLAQFAEDIRPEDREDFKDSRNVAVFHVRMAAKHMRDVAEAAARKEAQG